MLSMKKDRKYNLINKAHLDKKFGIFILILLLVTLSACTGIPTKQTATMTAEVTATPKPTFTLTPTKVPTLTPTPTQIPIADLVPACVPGEVSDTLTFDEVIGSLLPTVANYDSYRYHTIYQYQVGDKYADSELSVDVTGEHSLQQVTYEYEPYQLSSEWYENSHTTLTDLVTKQSVETIVAHKKAWVRLGDDPGWMALTEPEPQTLLNLAEVLSPSILFDNNIEEGVFSGIQTEAPAMAKTELVDGEELIHRCWILPQADQYFDAYLSFVDTATMYTDTEVHLWTTADDKQIVRFIMTGKHQAESGYELVILHDTPKNFLLWMEISDVNKPIEIVTPGINEISLDLASLPITKETINSPFNELPIPKDAEKVEVTDSLEDILGLPLEYVSYLYSNELDNELGWNDELPEERLADYETESGLTDTTAFYLDQMAQRGWKLSEWYVQVGSPRITLEFERENVTMPIALSDGSNKTTHISAILPPDDKTLEAILNGWQFYTTENSELPSDSVTSIAFSNDETAWIGTDSGVVSFDGSTWTSYIDQTNVSIRDITVDDLGNVWAGTDNGLLNYNGQTWRTYNTQNSNLPNDEIWKVSTDADGKLWLGIGDDTIGVWDSNGRKYYSAGEAGLPDSLDVTVLEPDKQGRIWIGTDDGEIYRSDGDQWQLMWSYMTFNDTEYFYGGLDNIAFDSQGWVWVLADGEVYTYDGQAWTYNEELNNSLPFTVNSLAIDNSNRIWLGGSDGTLAVFETDWTMNNYSPLQQDMGYVYIDGLEIDGAGRIWLGTSYSGIWVFTPPPAAGSSERTTYPTSTPTAVP